MVLLLCIWYIIMTIVVCTRGIGNRGWGWVYCSLPKHLYFPVYGQQKLMSRLSVNVYLKNAICIILLALLLIIDRPPGCSFSRSPRSYAHPHTGVRTQSRPQTPHARGLGKGLVRTRGRGTGKATVPQIYIKELTVIKD